jgi:SAM-dependent methyltransferase
MSSDDRVRWDNIYKQRADQPYPAPDPLLLQFTPPAEKDARALDLCGGVGQNGLWLAEQGYNTDIMDVSRVGLHRARKEMLIRNLRGVNLLPIDVDFLQLESEVYQLVCVFRYLRREIFPVIKRSVKVGGRVVYETFNVDYLTLVPQFNRAFLLEKGELAGFFDDWRVLYLEEETHVTRFVATK